MLPIIKSLKLMTSLKTCIFVVFVIIGIQFLFFLVLYQLVIASIMSYIEPVVNEFRIKGIQAHKVSKFIEHTHGP